LLNQRLAPLLRHAGDLESSFLGTSKRDCAIERPLFITGLARSGTTVLLNLLSQCDGIATHRYRDFPFLWTPLAWNWFQDRVETKEILVERPHRDRIKIGKESPEAFEEPLWQFFFPHVHDPERLHLLGPETEAADFESCFGDHIRKILSLRGGHRYLSKGNYNVARIEYLARLFPDAFFIVPLREPLGHVHSLVKQHRLFTDYARSDARIPTYLEFAGHYEFGPQRQPINFTQAGAAAVRRAWAAGDDYRGYARLWSEVYGHIARINSNRPDLAARILVLRYEAFCADPEPEFSRILTAAGLEKEGARVIPQLKTISAPADDTQDLSRKARDTVQNETKAVFNHFEN
jgi:hypothetical protein